MLITFSETKSFYNILDAQIKNGKAIIVFHDEKLNKNSKLWPRLKKCKNWSLIERELEKVKEEEETVIKDIVSPKMAAALTGGEIFLIAWIATLLTSLLFYGIYKNCNIKFKADKNGSIELEIDNS